MIDRIGKDFEFYQKALALRQQRQEILASNIANADTPNYKARDFDFGSRLSQAVEKGRQSNSFSLSTTSDARRKRKRGSNTP